MTKEEAIKIIDCYDIGFYDLSGEKIPAYKLADAFDMAIEALKGGDAEMQTIAKTPDYMQQSRHDDGRIEVVRCKDCKWWQDNNNGYPVADCKWNKEETPDAEDYCSNAERREP